MIQRGPSGNRRIGAMIEQDPVTAGPGWTWDAHRTATTTTAPNQQAWAKVSAVGGLDKLFSNSLSQVLGVVSLLE